MKSQQQAQAQKEEVYFIFNNILITDFQNSNTNNNTKKVSFTNLTNIQSVAILRQSTPIYI